MEKYDVVILGGGNAGMGVTVPTRAAGMSVAMIEARDLGGTCPNGGCTPKKVLVAAALAIHEIEEADCAGHVANVEGLDLGTGVIAHREGHIEIDDHLRSRSDPDVYVCGAAVWNSPQFSPVATYECGLVGRNIVDGLRHRPDDGQIPACLYTVPDLASVGLTEANAKEQGLGVRVHVNDIAGLAIRETYAETVAWSKVIVDETADRVVRAHLVGHAGFRALP